MKTGWAWLGWLTLGVLAACQQTPGAVPAPTDTAWPTTSPVTLTRPVQATVTTAATDLPAPTLAPTRTPTPAAVAVGPDDFPADVNPLTGLRVAQPDLLNVSPGLVSISNGPITARPQAGLSYASHVYEMYVGEGVTRFLAVFYGQLPPQETAGGGETHIGPIRSGRLPYEALRQLYRGFLVFGSASDLVLPHLEERHIVFGQPDAGDSNTAFILPAELVTIAADTVTRRGQPALLGWRFDPQPPAGGQPARRIWVPYHYTDQVFWDYDPEAGGYVRSQGNQDGTQVTPLRDRLTDMPLTSENVVVLFAQYRFFTPTFFDIDLLYISRLPALVFRDGRMYQAYWSTANQAYERTTGRLRPLHLVDGEGKPFPMKNGQTWMMFVPLYTAYNETVASDVFRELQKGNQPGSGNWALHFNAPPAGGWPTPTPPP